MKNLGWLSLYILLVALGVDGVAVKMGIKDAQALRCFQIYTVVHAAHLIVALSAGRGLTSWHNAGQAAALTALLLPYAVWLGLRLAPPMALILALLASLAAVWLPALFRRLRR